MADEPQKKKHDDQFEEKAKERLKARKEKAKKKPAGIQEKTSMSFQLITAVILSFDMGIYPWQCMRHFYQSTDDAFVEGRLNFSSPARMPALS